MMYFNKYPELLVGVFFVALCLYLFIDRRIAKRKLRQTIAKAHRQYTERSRHQHV